MASYIRLAAILSLPESDKPDQSKVKLAVQRWLSKHAGWLLILDNVESLSLVRQFVPIDRQGAVLLTTRRQVTEPVAQALELGSLSENDCILFLLKRTKILTFDMSLEDAVACDIADARMITQALGNLPLALDQAGAYILETKYSLSDYLDLWKKHQAELLRRRAGGEIPIDHPESVATTFTLNFQQVQQRSEVAAELLRICAFLASDGIGEEILVQEASRLGPTLQPLGSAGLVLNQAIEVLSTFSLIQRDPKERTLSIHRLVQAVIKDAMTQDEQRHWAELAVQSINDAFPRRGDYTTWPLCQRYLPHAQSCAELIKQWTLTSMDAFHLLGKTADYLYQRGQYDETERLLQQLLTVQKSIVEPDLSDTNTIVIMNNIAGLYRIRGRFAEAEKLYQLALGMCENIKEGVPPIFVSICSGLGVVYEKQRKFFEAEQLHRQALNIHLQRGEETLEVATCLNDLAMIYKYQGRFPEAKSLYLSSLAIRQKLLKPNDPFLAESMNNIGALYRSWRKYSQAEGYYLRAHRIKEHIYEPDHPRMATSYNNLAIVYEDQEKYSEAESYYQKAIEILERKLGPDHPNTKSALASYRNLLRKMNKRN